MFYTYILASKRNGTLYIGVTNNLERRIYEHKNNLIPGFTLKYNIYLLVYYEQIPEINTAIKREKQLKKWNRKWKLDLIERVNPNWNDLSLNWIPASAGMTERENDNGIGF
ncbi:hypothetical protein A3J15_02465 [Candidatus Roizmanbacteria bacterium RIFCSPLOWO2_02_FULL_38_10]|uniref:GIY-YIG domain-containing protein n=1 Tax=Candidatus Roizmanbacteria bacterium RIFCSPLOWO2_02_FULL_38_10 TaxID=1802074 RepID=A0A1F7JNB7_9BACT|nr:MAG: hypothetical protein A3J15_02465 [Candidatus Roizmanbacteria bacterium RIFCSPLOWO2_02_FULL_38_10]